MDKDKIQAELLDAVEQYVEQTEAWEDAVVTLDTETGHATLAEAADVESLPDTVDVYDIMDFVQMTPDGKWIPDSETIEATVAEM